MTDAGLLLLTIFWFCLLLLIPGGFTLLAAAKRGWVSYLRGWPEFIFLSFLGSFSLLSLFSLAAAQLGVFSITLVAGLLLLYSLLILVIFRPGGVRIVRKDPDGRGWRGRLPAIALLCIMALAGVLFFRPTEYIFGGWDPGVYAGTAAHIARTGSIVVADDRPFFLTPEERADFSREHRAGYLEKYPGFRRSGPGGTRLIPQFYHLFPALLAVASFPAGLAGGFYLTPILGMLSLLAVYLAVREFWSRSEALLAVFLLTVNLVQIWQARFPTAEMLGQFLLFSGLFVLARFLLRGDLYPAWLAGVLLGLFVLSHISALLIIPPLAIFFFCRWFLSFRREDVHLLLPLIILTAYSFLPHLVFGKHYAFLAADTFPGKNFPLPGLLCLLAAAMAAIRILKRPFRERAALLLQKKGWRRAAAAAVILLALGGYFVRPAIGGLSADRTNLVELGWFLTLPGLVLGVAGICLLILGNRRAPVWVFLLITLAFSGLFLWRQMIHPYYLWAARRFAAVIIPGFLICAARAIVQTGHRRPYGRPLALGAFLLIAVLEISHSRVLFAHREYRGAADFLNGLAGRIRGADLVAVEGSVVDKLPAPLHLGYGFSVLPIYLEGKGQLALIARLFLRECAGRPAGEKEPVVYLLTGQEPAPLRGVRFQPEAEIKYHAPLLERSGVHIPGRLDDRAPDGTIEVKIYRMLPE
ncbi:MAG: glycosyltransferase family 39 protein [PVC group bacterium]